MISGSWFVGDLALSQVPTGELLRLRGRTANEQTMGNAFRLRLAKVAIGKLMRGIWNREPVHLRISTGLPVDHMPDAAEFKTALLGQHLVQTDCAELIANMIEVMVMPQPLGTVYANLLTENGEINAHHTFMRTGVVDVGTFTVDIALDEDGEFKDAESGSVESGVYHRPGTHRRAVGTRSPPENPVQHRRTGAAHRLFHGQRQAMDYSAEVEEALAPLRSATLNLISEKWKRGATVEVIYLSGGGAELVYEQVAEAYPQTVLVPNAQLANARGYLNYAHFVAGREGFNTLNQLV